MNVLVASPKFPANLLCFTSIDKNLCFTKTIICRHKRSKIDISVIKRNKITKTRRNKQQKSITAIAWCCQHLCTPKSGSIYICVDCQNYVILFVDPVYLRVYLRVCLRVRPVDVVHLLTKEITYWFIFFILIEFDVKQMNSSRREKDMQLLETIWILHLLVRNWIAFLNVRFACIVRNSNFIYLQIELIPGVEMAYNDRHPKPPTPIKPKTPTPEKEPTPPGKYTRRSCLNLSNTICSHRRHFIGFCSWIAIQIKSMDLTFV